MFSFSSFINNCPKLVTMKCPSTVERVNTFQYIHAKEYYSARQRSRLLKYKNMGVSLQHYAKWRKPGKKKKRKHDSIYMKFQNRPNYSDRKQIRFQGPGMETGFTEKSTRKLFVKIKLFCNMIIAAVLQLQSTLHTHRFCILGFQSTEDPKYLERKILETSEKLSFASL